jgi:hypothetical protein
VNAARAGAAAGTLVPHPPQKIDVAFNAEPQLPQNLAISQLLASRRGSICLFRSERAYSIEPNPSTNIRKKPAAATVDISNC